MQSLVPKYSVWVVLPWCVQSWHENGQNERCLDSRFQDVLTWREKVDILFCRFNSDRYEEGQLQMLIAATPERKFQALTGHSPRKYEVVTSPHRKWQSC